MKGGVETTVGYKEWGAVCKALGTGGQSLLLRKGGIHEGREGFSFKHDRFWLFPTRFHAQSEQVRVDEQEDESGESGEWQVGDAVPLQYYCEAVWARTLSDWKKVAELERFHVWTESLVRERFDCGEVQQIHCALVRVSALAEPHMIPYQKKYGGCRTWVDLPALPERMESGPVLGKKEFSELARALEEIVG